MAAPQWMSKNLVVALSKDAGQGQNRKDSFIWKEPTIVILSSCLPSSGLTKLKHFIKAKNTDRLRAQIHVIHLASEIAAM